MKPFLSFAPAALALAASCMLSGCDLFGAPPTQLEARLFLSGTAIIDKEALARNLVQELNIGGLKLDNVRIASDEEEKTHFFRLVGKEALPPALLSQVGAALAKINQDASWQGKLNVESDATAAAIMKTDKREFPINASWQSAQVDAYLIQSAAEAMFAGRAHLPGQAELPKRVACVVSFTPKEGLPKLTGKYSDVVPEQEDKWARYRSAGLMASEVTVPYKISLAHPELAKLQEPVVEDGKILFQFAQVDDAKVTVIGAGIEGRDPLTIDHGTVDICQSRLRELAPGVQRMIDRSALLAEVAAIGPARVVPLPAR